jgi:aerobic C4-dicarboxylate transport protein
MDIIPKTLLSAFVEGNILQVLFVAVLFGIALAMVGEKGKPVLNFLEALVARCSSWSHPDEGRPIGAFGAMAFTIGKYGVGSLVNLAWLVGPSTSPRAVRGW